MGGQLLALEGADQSTEGAGLWCQLKINKRRKNYEKSSREKVSSR